MGPVRQNPILSTVVTTCITAPVHSSNNAGTVICLKQGANDLHIVQLMPLPSHHLVLLDTPVKNWRNLSEQFYCLHFLHDDNFTLGRRCQCYLHSLCSV